MSVFYNAYFVKTPVSETKLKEKFSRVDVMPESEWIVCDFGDRYPTGIFEPGAYFTKEISAQFGETIFVCVDTRNDQFEYEHSQSGAILRKLCWLSDGSQSTWALVEGEREAWEDEILFAEANFARARELIKYDEHLALVTGELLRQKEQELRVIWENRQYILNGKWPLGDATIGMAIQKFFGLKVPVAVR